MEINDSYIQYIFKNKSELEKGKNADGMMYMYVTQYKLRTGHRTYVKNQTTPILNNT